MSSPKPNISEIKNKQLRAELYKKMKQEKAKAKKEEKKRKEKERKELGEDAPPKQQPHTIESLRVYDETFVSPEDEEVMQDQAMDEMADHLASDDTSQVLITTSDKPTARTIKFCKELKKSIPNSIVLCRRALNIKDIVEQAKAREFKNLIVVHEDRKKPNGLVLCHLPDGPTAHFKISNVVFAKEIKQSGDLTDHVPEVILKNFSTRLGCSVGRMLATLYPKHPEFIGRRVVTFHNQRDYIFFRQHRYQFRSTQKASLQELGPRFTLKLRSLQKGTFDSKYGEFEYLVKREKNRRKFVL